MRSINTGLFIFAIACEPRVHPWPNLDDDDQIEPGYLCDEVISIIPSDEISALGFSPAMAMSRLEGIMDAEATTDDPATSTDIVVAIEQIDGPITLVEFVDPETGGVLPLESDSACEPYVSIPIEAVFLTSDDSFAFTQELELQVTGIEQAYFEMAMDVWENTGSHIADMSDADSAEYRLRVSMDEEETAGELSLLTEATYGDGPDSMVLAELTTLLAWTTAL